MKEASTKLFLPDDGSTTGGTGNLVGLVIGPRGNTQKRLQAETGCTVVVRGKYCLPSAGSQLLRTYVMPRWSVLNWSHPSGARRSSAMWTSLRSRSTC